jgi:phage major head subunit gpT-like protein
MKFNSDQDSETYNWIGQSPAMREWIGGRQAKGFREDGFTVLNKHYEATIEILIKELRRDKSGQAMVRIRNLAERANAHWASLLSAKIAAGESVTCYDSQFFFDTDHEEGDSGAQSNDISVDISTLPASVHGSTTAPSVEEFQQVAIQAIQAILSFKDDRGEPMNELAQNFLIMVPTSMWITGSQAFRVPVGTDINSLVPANLNISVVSNARFTWTDRFPVFRTDGSASALIRQQETDVNLLMKWLDSEFAFDNDAVQVGVDSWRNVDYGFWQNACLATMT